MVSHSVQLLFIKPLILPHTSHTKSFALSFQFFTGLAAVFAEERAGLVYFAKRSAYHHL